MTKKVINITTIIAMILVAIIALILLSEGGRKTIIIEEKSKVTSVEDYIYEKYFSTSDMPRKAYEIKSHWKNDELQYVTVQYNKNEGVEVWTYVAIFDNDLNVVKGLGGTDREAIWEDVYKIAEGL